MERITVQVWDQYQRNTEQKFGKAAPSNSVMVAVKSDEESYHTLKEISKKNIHPSKQTNEKSLVYQHEPEDRLTRNVIKEYTINVINLVVEKRENVSILTEEGDECKFCTCS